MSAGESCDVFPWPFVAPGVAPVVLKRSAIVAARPSCRSGVRQPTPISGGTWNDPPVPTSTVWLLVSFPPAWHVLHCACGLSKIALPRLAALGSTHEGAGGAGTVCTQPVSAPI